ncbi:MAG: alkaline phosphatase D family protein [Phycisphaeraceae bacterium]
MTRIAFGSCMRENKPAPIWDAVAQQKPEIFLFIGDNIYADTEDMEVMLAKYQKLGAMEGYQRLKKVCPIWATWDDHDYGVNDGGAEYPMKVQSQQVMLKFFEEPTDSPRWKREGVYDAKVFGPEGKRVQIILLDTRYFRSPLKKVPKAEQKKGMGPYVADDRAELTMLGEAQWKWLAQELSKPAEVRIVATSVQAVPQEHGWEYWENFPQERRRLFKVIGEAKANGVILISGDRHLAEISKLATDDPDNGAGYPVYDVTSSSLNVPSGGNVGEVNKHRVGEHYRLVNFGTILIDWADKDPLINLQIRDEKGQVAREEAVRLSSLKGVGKAPARP